MDFEQRLSIGSGSSKVILSPTIGNLYSNRVEYISIDPRNSYISRIENWEQVIIDAVFAKEDTSEPGATKSMLLADGFVRHINKEIDVVNSQGRDYVIRHLTIEDIEYDCYVDIYLHGAEDIIQNGKTTDHYEWTRFFCKQLIG